MPSSVSNTWEALLAAIVSGSAIPWIFRHGKRILTGESLAQSDVLEADARKTNVETDGLLGVRLWAEIERLDVYLKEVRAELTIVKSSAADEKEQLETENKRLRAEVRRLTIRVAGLEDVLRVRPLDHDMKAMLDELDRKTGKQG